MIIVAKFLIIGILQSMGLTWPDTVRGCSSRWDLRVCPERGIFFLSLVVDCALARTRTSRFEGLRSNGEKLDYICKVDASSKRMQIVNNAAAGTYHRRRFYCIP